MQTGENNVESDFGAEADTSRIPASKASRFAVFAPEPVFQPPTSQKIRCRVWIANLRANKFGHSVPAKGCRMSANVLSKLADFRFRGYYWLCFQPIVNTVTFNAGSIGFA